MDLFIKSRKTWKFMLCALHCCQNVEKLSPSTMNQGYPQTEEGSLHCFPPSSLHLISQIICIPSSITDNNNKYSFFVKLSGFKGPSTLDLVFVKVWILKIYNLYYLYLGPPLTSGSYLSSLTQSYLILCDLMDHSPSGSFCA